MSQLQRRGYTSRTPTSDRPTSDSVRRDSTNEHLQDQLTVLAVGERVASSRSLLLVVIVVIVVVGRVFRRRTARFLRILKLRHEINARPRHLSAQLLCRLRC